MAVKIHGDHIHMPLRMRGSRGRVHHRTAVTKTHVRPNGIDIEATVPVLRRNATTYMHLSYDDVLKLVKHQIEQGKLDPRRVQNVIEGILGAIIAKRYEKAVKQ